ncbi:retrovirus-related pol polyprotein from transposon TNT 1-94 [Tanacetum coccineum]|uniref:Retrovirus-related pol polyprotein from transposon TNT 1-94 n=1 Tax=Tanacetum coccineum TaxID=301880 RepID=A0ABQ5CGR1_9ASTR
MKDIHLMNIFILMSLLTRYQTNKNDVSFIEPYEYPEPVVLETKVSSDQNGQTGQNDHNDKKDQSVQNDEILIDDHSEHSNHTNDEQIIDNLLNTKDIQISEHSSSPRSWELGAALAHECLFIDFLSKEEPKKVSETLQHPAWVDAMQDELNQFARNKVWTLVPVPYAQGYNQQEGIDYDETFSLVARSEAIRIFLAFATYMYLKVDHKIEVMVD